MSELESIRQRKLEELQRHQQAAAEQDFLKQQLEGVKKTVLQRFLTKDARERLATVRVANKELAEHVELAILEAAQSGQIRSQLDEEKLKEILGRVSGTKKGFRIIK